jgi:DNA-binding NtrC family response regulator
MDRVIDKIPAETIKALVNWPWPGNVRELENFIERSVILTRGPILRAPVNELIAAASRSNCCGATLEEVERDYVLRVFRQTGGVVSVTAARLGIPRTTLNAMMTRLGISRGNL